MSKNKIKFPALHKGLTKHEEETFLSDYIYIKDDHAFIFNPAFIFITDLKTLLSLNNNEEQHSESYEDALLLLEYLDEKYVSYDYWDEIVSGEVLKIHSSVEKGDYLNISSKGIDKDLYYISPLLLEDSLTMNIQELRRYATMAPLGSGVSNVPFSVLVSLNAMLGTKIKNDSIIFEHFGKDKRCRFTFKSNRHFFGLIDNDYETNEEMFLSLPLEEIIKLLIQA